MIIDYSTARPSAAALKAAGVTAVGRYTGWDSVPGFASIGKNLTPSEAEHLISNGFSIWLAFEYAADAARHGAVQGTKDGRLATEQLHALSAPPGMGVYFAVDFDIPDYAPHLAAGSASARAKLGPVGDYFAAIRAAKPAYQVGGYGGYWAVSRLLDAGLITLGWQASAWSPRNADGTVKFDPRAVLRQHLGTPLPGTDLDTARLSTAHGPDFGQWPRPGTAPARPELETHVTAGHMSLHDLAAQRGTTAARILRLTAKWDAFTPETYAWINDVFSPDTAVLPEDPMPAGLTLRCPRLPS